mgnify:CR=1 FL=1
MVFEVSATYAIILPVMIANILAYLVSRSLQPRGVFDELHGGSVGEEVTEQTVEQGNASIDNI